MRAIPGTGFSRTFSVLAAAFLVALLAGPPTRSHAQSQPANPPEALQAATDLVALMSKDLMRQMSAQVIGAMWPGIERDLRQKRPSMSDELMADLRREFEQITTKFMIDVMKDGPEIYARHFTAQELRDMIAFYRTPTGVKALQLMPQVMAETMKAITPRMQNLEAELSAAFARVLRQRGI